MQCIFSVPLLYKKLKKFYFFIGFRFHRISNLYKKKLEKKNQNSLNYNNYNLYFFKMKFLIYLYLERKHDDSIKNAQILYLFFLEYFYDF
jgi:hypothetical protein